MICVASKTHAEPPRGNVNGDPAQVLSYVEYLSTETGVMEVFNFAKSETKPTLYLWREVWR